MNISEHFTLEELSFSETASRLGLDNTPSPTVMTNLKLLAAGDGASPGALRESFHHCA
jgi:zinc D-Ala-D-Ala carboxypeptidase